MIKKIQFGITLFLTLCSTLVIAQNPSLDWVQTLGSATADDDVEAMTTDSFGNLYVVGGFEDTIDLNPSATATQIVTSKGDDDIFVQKFDPSGSLIWAHAIGGKGFEYSRSINVDASGDLYITGSFQDTIDFDPGPAVNNLSSQGGIDGFILKLDASGIFLWAKSFGGKYSVGCLGATLTPSGNIYTVGYLKDTVDFDPGPATFNLISTGICNAYVQKLDANANFIWAKAINSTSFTQGQVVSTDGEESVYVSGRFSGTADFDPAATTHNIASNGSEDAYVFKLDSSGNFGWAVGQGGISIDYGRGVVNDANNNTYVTGKFRGTVDFDPDTSTFNVSSNGNSDDVYVQKLDTAGQLIWVKTYGGDRQDWGNAITLDNFGNVYIAGSFSDTVDFDPGPGVHRLVSKRFRTDVFIQKLDPMGNFVWAESLTGPESDGGSEIVVTDSGKVYVSGTFKDSVDFDPGTPSLVIHSNGGRDVFIQKFGQCRVETTDTITACDSLTWIDGNTYFMSHDTAATFGMISATGCDSIITLNLTVLNRSVAADTIEACVSYTWINGTTYTSSATDTYTTTNAAGCDSVVTLNLTINPVDVSLTTSGTQATANATGADYQWLDCDSNFIPIVGETTNTFTATENGSYAVEVTQNGCVDTSSCIVIQTIGIPTSTALENISIYPNPSKGPIRIDLGEVTNTDIRLFDIQGTLHYRKTNFNGKTLQLDPEVTAGMYILEISTPQGQMRYSLVRE